MLKKFKFTKNKTNSKGALLLELLIVISLLAIILSIGANAVFLSLRSNKVSGERDVANALASESLEAVRAITAEDWQNIYSLTGKGSTHYQTTISGTKWAISAGDETVSINGISYTRYVTIDNVSRDSSTRAIVQSGGVDDPSTQKATVTVSWPSGGPVVIYEYFFRWKNKVCPQAGWVTGGSGNTLKDCTDTSYDTKDTVIDNTGGSLQLQ